jgi:hypothetical protein
LAKPKAKAPQRSFPIWLVIAGAALLMVAIWALINSGQNRVKTEVIGAPGIKVEQDIYNYGDVKLGEKPIRTVVRVTNVGDQTLRFTKAPYVEVLEGC